MISKGRKLVGDPESEDFRKQAASTQPTSVRLSRQQPTKQEVAGLPVVKFELEDRVLLKMITGIFYIKYYIIMIFNNCIFTYIYI